jgi:CRISPR-associated protein Cas1
MIESRDGLPAMAIALTDLEAVILGNPQIHLSQAVLAQLAAASVPLVVCDAKHQPAGLLVPLVGNAVQTERIRAQAVATEPRRKQLWKQIVQAKLRNQAGLLEARGGSDHGLRAMALQVVSGDTTNREAQGARRYWTALFGPVFRRERDAADANRFLNYGYTLLRSLAARALVGAGLHPSLGVQHHNRYDPLALASDLMEPYRPWVDARVAKLVDDGALDLNQAAKSVLFGLFQDPVALAEERWPLQDALHRSAARLAQAYAQGRVRLLLPAW